MRYFTFVIVGTVSILRTPNAFNLIHIASAIIFLFLILQSYTVALCVIVFIAVVLFYRKLFNQVSKIDKK